jgi:multicomponent Na+:H+ antiporter subunit D
MHLTGGVVLLAGILTHYASTGSIEVTAITAGLPMVFFIIGVGLNAGFIPLHTWLPDAYPTAPLAGSIFMSVYTTKTAVYLLARTLSGMEVVAYMGAIMAVYGVSFALMQNNARKLLSYHIISQVGYMVAVIGIGGAMGINGAIFHLFNNVLYKTILFMGIGAVLYRTGIEDLTRLGGLWKKMPVTTVAVSVAALSISGWTLFNGFASKGMIFEAAHGNDVIYLMLELAAVGTFLSFLKLTYFGFFRRNDSIEAKEAPLSMTIPMVVLAFFCVLIGVYPSLMVDILPYPVPADFHFYSLGHVVGVWELLGVTAIIFFVGKKYYAPHDRVTLDFDYFYLKGINGFASGLREGVGLSSSFINTTLIWAKTLAHDLRLGSTINPIVALNDYIGEAYEFMVLKPVRSIASYCLTFDLGIIDGMVNGAAWLTRVIAWGSHLFDIYIVDGIVNSAATLVEVNSGQWRRLQTGYLQNYAWIIIFGLLLILGGIFFI